MIIVRVELHGAQTGRVEDLGTAVITNDGSGNEELGNYLVRLLKGAKYSRHTGDLYRQGRVVAFRRKLGPWPLIWRALDELLNRTEKE